MGRAINVYPASILIFGIVVMWFRRCTLRPTWRAVFGGKLLRVAAVGSGTGRSVLLFLTRRESI